MRSLAAPLALALLASACASTGRLATDPHRGLAEAYVDAPEDRSPALSFDGRRLAFVRVSGGGQHALMVTDYEGPAARDVALVSGPAALAAPSFSPDGAWLYVRERLDGDAWRLLRMRPYGTERSVVGPTTAGRSVEDYRVTPDGARLVLLEREVERAGLHLAVTGSGGDVARDLQRLPSAGLLTDVAPDGASALVTFVTGEAGVATSVRVLLDGGGMERVGPDRGAHAATFAPDGQGYYLSTSGPGGTRVLRRLAADRRSAVAEYVPTAGSAGRVLAGRALAVVIDHGDHDSLHLLDPATLALRVEVPLGPGTVELGGVTPDGERLLVAWSSVGAPSHLLSVSLATGEPLHLRAFHAPGLAGPGTFDVLPARVPAPDGQPIPVHAVLPRDRAPDARLPVLVLLHDGPARTARARWDPLAAFLVAHHVAVVRPNVRGSAGFGAAWAHADDGRRRFDAFRDLEAVRTWVGRQSWADDTRVGVAGRGYGGYLAWGALAWRPDDWAPGVVLDGWADLAAYLEQASAVDLPRLRREYGTLGADRDHLASVSPANQLDAVTAPVLVAWSTAAPHDAPGLVAALRARAARVVPVVDASPAERLMEVLRFLRSERLAPR